MDLNTRICFLNKHNTKNNQFKLHSHDCYEVVYFVTGNGRTIINGKSHPVSANSYCIILPHTEHIEALEGYGEILFIGFEYDGTLYPLEEGVYDNGGLTKRSFFNAIFDEYKEQALGYENAANYLLRLFLLSLLRKVQTEDRKCKDLDYIKNYIQQHADQKIRFKDLASLSGYSYDYFRHIFKQRYGISPQEYMMDIRLSNARQLLESTTLSCTEIAYRCGFSTGAQMTAMFKAKYNETPTAVRKADSYKTSYGS